MKSKIYYWSPFLSEVATVKAVINSAFAISRYSKNEYETYIIDVFGEFKKFEDEIKKKNIKLIRFKRSILINFFLKPGYFRSRILTIFVFIRYFFPLLFLLKKNPPTIFVMHLVTSLPLLINFFFRINSKMILRISGLPKLNLLRKFFWKLTIKKIDLVTAPTVATLNNLLKKKIVNSKKVVVLRDPIIFLREIVQKKIVKLNDNQIEKNKYFISIGRLSRQKNFEFLINNLKDYLLKNCDFKLIILGDGEKKQKLQNLINQKKLEKQILLLGFKKNIFQYLKDAKAFILPSLWEDPGFVILESAFMNIPIISSDCPNGPREILDYGKAGFLFCNNDNNDFKKNLSAFLNTNDSDLLKKKIAAKKQTREYSIFNHAKNFRKIINNL